MRSAGLPVLVELVRSGVVESTHTGSVVVLRPDGSVAGARGVVDAPVFPRSANKPLQAVGLLDAGWRPPDARVLALATASHSGEPEHLEAVRRCLAAAGLSEAALQCPALPPLSQDAAAALLGTGQEPTPLTMNYSGKHAAMLAVTVAGGGDPAGYLGPDSPVQRAIRATIERLAGEPVRHVAVDGCGAPQHALTLTGLARAFGVLATAGGNEGRTAAAMRAYPFLVGGSGREVTALLEGIPGLVVKDGAEGVYAAALPDGSAVAVKIADGAMRAAVVVLVAGLRRLGVQAEVLDRLGSTPVLGGGVPVGELRPTVGLLQRPRSW